MRELPTAIQALEEELLKLEREAAELRSAINVLCKRNGLEPRYAESASMTDGPTVGQIRPDSFYGKKMQTAAREFLDMRKGAKLGPATPKEIYIALAAGGFQFEARDEETALIGVRATLRKNSATFHKLPNGQYGLTVWYPNAKPPKDDEGEDLRSKPRKRPTKAPKETKDTKDPKLSRPNGAAPSGPVRGFILSLLIGNELGLDQIKKRAISDGIKVPEGKSLARALNATLLSLQRQGAVEKHGANWRLSPPQTATAH